MSRLLAASQADQVMPDFDARSEHTYLGGAVCRLKRRFAALSIPAALAAMFAVTLAWGAFLAWVAYSLMLFLIV